MTDQLTERMRMCLAEAGFVEGRDYDIIALESGGCDLSYAGDDDRPALRSAIDKASMLCSGRHVVWPSSPLGTSEAP